jgi:UDP-N-acetylglucosamine--N-acetylmuramyl-(pentapeptide) pyrophosphoryl-undecaprenol N-acetylglucosamine transferase
VTEESLLGVLVGLLTDGPRRAAIAERARSLARPGALEKIVEMVTGLAAEQRR